MRLIVLLGTILIMAAVGAFIYDSPSKEAYSYADSITVIEPDQVSEIFTVSGKGNTLRLLFIYTSWCPFCKQQFPEIMKLAEAYREQNMETYLLSLDRDILKLSSFIVESYPQLKLTPHILSTDSREAFAHALRDAGSNFTGGIPYHALVNQEGKVLAEFQGIVDKATLADSIDSIMRATNG